MPHARPSMNSRFDDCIGYGFYIESSDFRAVFSRDFLGICNDRTIYLNNLIFKIEPEEYDSLRKLYDKFEMEFDIKEEEERLKKISKDLILLSELASLENINMSRRVLTEKYKHFKF